MHDLLERRSALSDEAIAIFTKSGGPTAEDLARAKDLNNELKELDTLLNAAGSRSLDLGGGTGTKGVQTLGDHFIKSVGDNLGELRSHPGMTVGADEFGAKAEGDTIAVGDGGDLTPILTDYDRTVVKPKRQRPVIADLMGSGTVTGNAISYFIEGAEYGDFATVAEGARKPQISFDNPTATTDPIRKIAGWIKVTDEFLEDLPFLKSEIDNRLMHKLAMVEEFQLLRGDGVGTNIRGLLNRDGLQIETAASEDDLADAVFRATTKISTATDLTADGVGIHPLDYEAQRLRRDGNGQYYGGGFFQNAYGNGGILQTPPLWGLNTVISPAFEKGKPVVGNFNLGSTVYRKGGVRVAATSSNEDDFVNNKVTIRAEERIGLAVRVPAAFVKVEVADAGAGA